MVKAPPENLPRVIRSAVRVHPALRAQALRVWFTLWEAAVRVENRLGRGPRIGGGTGPIVSLTSHGKRLHLVFVTLESIVRGSTPPGEVYLWLAHDELTPADVPKTLRRMEKRGLQIRFAEQNFRPGNKLVHTLKLHPDRPIVVCDDDLVYPRDWLSGLVRSHQRRPDCIACYRAHVLRPDGRGGVAPYISGYEQARSEHGPLYSNLATGTSGVLYPPGSLDQRVHDHNVYLETSLTTDDIWFKVMSLLAGTRTWRIPIDPSPMTRMIRGSQHTALWRGNAANDRNNQALNVLFSRYEMVNMLADAPRTLGRTSRGPQVRFDEQD